MRSAGHWGIDDERGIASHVAQEIEDGVDVEIAAHAGTRGSASLIARTVLYFGSRTCPWANFESVLRGTSASLLRVSRASGVNALTLARMRSRSSMRE